MIGLESIVIFRIFRTNNLVTNPVREPYFFGVTELAVRYYSEIVYSMTIEFTIKQVDFLMRMLMVIPKEDYSVK